MPARSLLELIAGNADPIEITPAESALTHALLSAATQLDSLQLEGDEGVDLRVFHRGLEEPLRQLIERGCFKGSVVLGEVRRRQRFDENPNLGFDVAAEEYAGMPAYRIVDPARVTRSTCEHALSVAGMILTIEAPVPDALHE